MKSKGHIHVHRHLKKDVEWYIPGVGFVAWVTVFVSPSPCLFYNILSFFLSDCFFNKGDEDYSSYAYMMTYQHIKSGKPTNKLESLCKDKRSTKIE